MNCWILNTKDDDHGVKTPRWEHFKAENVISVGWEVPPDKRKTKADVVSAIKSYDVDRGDVYVKRAANTVFTFLKDMHQYDNVILCAGYNSQQKEVKIYALATISKEELRYGSNSTWWQIKRDVTIDLVDKLVSREELARILGKGSCCNTLTKLDCEKFLILQSYLRGKGYLK